MKKSLFLHVRHLPKSMQGEFPRNGYLHFSADAEGGIAGALASAGRWVFKCTATEPNPKASHVEMIMDGVRSGRTDTIPASCFVEESDKINLAPLCDGLWAEASDLASGDVNFALARA